MTSSDDSKGDPRLRVVSGADSSLSGQNIRAAMGRLLRLEDILIEMLRGMGRNTPPLLALGEDWSESAPSSSPPRPGQTIHLSRQILDELARIQGEAPLRDQPDISRRGLRMVGGRDMRADSVTPATQPPALVLHLRIGPDLRLCLAGNLYRVGIEQQIGASWRRLDLVARKDGAGGVMLDLVALEREAGRTLPELRRCLQMGSGCKSDPPCHDKG
jgi:hypothetical protein